jgi:iron complex outermembrane recepter protein
MTFPTTRKTKLAAATFAATFSLSVTAQPRPALEEVVVTAQKRAENLQDTAIAITAISGSTMDELNIRDSSDYEMLVPSLSVRNSPARLFLRGVGRVTNSLGTDPGVAVYLDEAYTSEFTVLNRATSLTTESIDILRGPQGTLFGRNTTGGAVSVTSLKPTEEFENHVRATAGDYDQFDVGASSSGPITDDLGYRVYGYSNTRDGYLDNLSGDDPWDQDQWGAGAQLSWDPTDTVNVWLSYATDIRNNVRDTSANQGGYLISPYQTNIRSETDGFLFSEAFQWDRENPAVNDPYKVDMSDVLKAKDNSNNKWITHLTWDLDSVTLKYIGSYFDGKYTGTQGDVGFTSNPVNRVVEDVAQESTAYSNEIQFISASDGPLQWVGGLYYYHQKVEQPYTIRSINADYLGFTVPDDDFLNRSAVKPNLGDNWQYNQEAELETDSYAAFAEANYSFNESWKLTAGLRYSYDEKTGYEQQYVVADPNATYSPASGTGTDPSAFDALKGAWNAFGFPQNCCGFLITDPQEANRKLEDDWDNVSGRIVLDYMINDESMVYGGISTGYKSGGFRLGSIQPNPSFDPEELLAYEIGYKGTFNDTLQVNAAAYYYDYDNMQVLVPRLTDENLPVEEVVNADKAEIKGFEVEAIWLATDHLTLMGNYSYIDGEYTKFCCAIDTLDDPDGAEEDLSGNPLTQAPKNKIFFNASYSITTNKYGEFVPSASYSWVDERQYDVFNRDVTKADDYYRVDALITWYSPTDDLRIIASGRNLTDKQTWTSLARLNSFGALTGQINEPRTWSIEVQYDF